MTTHFQRTDRRHGSAVQPASDEAQRVRNISAALLELAQQCVGAANDDDAWHRLAEGLKEIGELETVAVMSAISGSRRGIRAVSGMTTIDSNAENVRHWETLLKEAVRDAEADCVKNAEPIGESIGIHLRPWCVAVRSRTGRVFGACAIVLSPSHDTAATRSLVETSLEILGPIFETALVARQRSGLARLWSVPARILTGRRRMLAIAAVLVGACFVPLPISVRCDGELQPQVRRSVAAPFAATWRKSFVRPGDSVAVGQPLGLLDSTELTRELTAATAERDRAAKSADVNAAAGKTAAAQIDRLEVRRIDERRGLLAGRLANIEVKSPIAGLVLSGEWERAEGAPIKQGTVLFEIAPLDRVTVDVLVPESELGWVQQGAATTIVLDARPYENRAGIIGRIYPRAEIRDEANVFVAEVELDNADGSLRPGMKGRVHVETEPRSVMRLIADRFGPTASLLRW